MLLFKKNLYLWVRVSLLSILILGSVVLLQACFPFGPEDIEDFDIVGTFYDENINFSTFKYYAMPDTIAKVENSVVSKAPGEFDALILSQVAANMGAAGYTRVNDPDSADMLLTLAISRDGNTLDNNYDYGDYYGDDYDYGSGGYYNRPSMWVGIINGVTEQSFTNVSRRLIELINQAFAQSTYLGTSTE
jgi:hypothetical protein